MVDSNVDNNVVYISGKLDFEAVPLLDKNNRKLIARSSNVIFDLSKVTFSDNTGVAFLVVLTSYANRLKKEIVFVNLPEQLLDLLSAVNVEKILPISKK